MAYSISANEVITYEPEALRSFFVYSFEWIDNLLFLQSPQSLVGLRAADYEAIAKERFVECGWEGNGTIQLLWLPSFVFPLSLNIQPTGIAIWHVKQIEDGVSFLLSPIQLPFPELSGKDNDT
ncbi:hypothetical protein DB032_12970 [Chromobacterium sp. Panama]|uniref:hypothetical protein n=1 Tax=Chromobacterium sp. Panama TaxID=2161826 RepID=UPI000D2FDB46|nr:hypothetical protein [Chromobacterium sp. Panama]PTU65782.1 hypothetical protein DB032_12970 [Chromobacterium sp. Panama]